DFAMQAATGHKDYFAALEPMQPERHRQLETEARESLARQQAIETGDKLSLEDYITAYFSRD
ncbi:MAG TPA: glutamate--cysteine ligase, partial [Woeseiaceae bacterium]